MSAVQAAVLLLLCVGALGVVAAKDPRRQVMVFGIYGGLLTIFFFAFQAPDVALSQLAVGAAAYPLMILLVLAKAAGSREPPQLGKSAPEPGSRSASDLGSPP